MRLRCFAIDHTISRAYPPRRRGYATHRRVSGGARDGWNVGRTGNASPAGKSGRRATHRAAAPAARGPAAPPTPVFTLADHFLQWRLLPGEKAYEAIDGNHLLQYVNDLAAISRRYRDAGHPQFWGRIIGSSADQDDAQWLMSQDDADRVDRHPHGSDRFGTAVVSAVVGSDGDMRQDKSLRLETAQPAYTTPGTTGAGLDLEVVYAGLGSEADLLGRDFRGKAVLIFSNPMPGSWRHTSTQEAVVDEKGLRTTWLQLAEKNGAAAILCSIQRPGNIRTQLYPTNTRRSDVLGGDARRHGAYATWWRTRRPGSRFV